MFKRTMSVVAAAVAMTVSGFFVGCEGGGDDDSSGGGGSFTGSWALYSGSSIQGSPAWYVHFNSDNTFTISDNADGSAQRVSGTYTVTDGKLVGPFTNPGVGEGRVEATITDGVMSLDFIEYWHTPNKVVHYTGSKL